MIGSYENAVFGRDGRPQPSALLKSGAVGPPRPTIFIRSGELEKVMGYSHENARSIRHKHPDNQNIGR
jgi:hypothetical protein